MNKKLFYILVCAVLLLSACGQAATVAPTEPPVVATEPAATEAPTEVATEAAGPCLIIGALYGGPITDAGYNQAMHEAVMEIKTNIECVKIIEAENVPNEAGATTTM